MHGKHKMNNNTIAWHCKPFSELTAKELYKILKLRNEVFVVEQNCAYLDTDEKDYKALHLFAEIDNEIAAYARLLPQGISYKDASIGRVVTAASYRNVRLGKTLMQKAIDTTLSFFGTNSIRISAQSYLIKFYSNLGFRIVSDEYLEDDIPHVEMLLTVS